MARNPNSSFLRRQRDSRSGGGSAHKFGAWEQAKKEQPTITDLVHQGINGCSDVLLHIDSLDSSVFASLPLLYRAYLRRASGEIGDLLKLLTSKLSSANDIEVLEATAGLLDALATAEVEPETQEVLAAYLGRQVAETTSQALAGFMDADRRRYLEVVSARVRNEPDPVVVTHNANGIQAAISGITLDAADIKAVFKPVSPDSGLDYAFRSIPGIVVTADKDLRTAGLYSGRLVLNTAAGYEDNEDGMIAALELLFEAAEDIEGVD